MKKHTDFEYIKTIFSLDKRLFVMMLVSILSTIIWDLFPIGIVAYLLNIYQTHEIKSGFPLIVLVCAVFALIKIIHSGFTMFIYNEFSLRIDRKIQYQVNKQLFEKITKVDYETYQSSEFLNNYQKVLDNAPRYMLSTFWDFSNLIERIFSLITLGTIFSLINPLIMVYGVFCGIIGYFISSKISKLYHVNSEKNKQNIRERGYVRRIFYLKDSAIDLRTTKINDLYLDMNDEIGDKVVKNIDNYVFKSTFLNSINIILMQSIFAVSLALIASTIIESRNIVILASLITAISTLSEGIWSLSETVSSYKENIIYKNDFYRVLDTESKIEEFYDYDIKELEEFKIIDFRNVDFSYGEKKVLKNINLSIKKGQKIAIVGENGAGKTTFVKLLLRLYGVSSGSIFYNNNRYNDLNPTLIRDSFITVFQNYQIYAVSVSENILMRKVENEEDEKLVIDSLKKVGLYGKVISYPNGINTMCTKEFDKDGIEFSGGERQKLVLARVFASTAPIILLDEPNSALDPLAEKRIFDEIFKFATDKTLIFISHRFSTTVNADKIYLFKNGKVFEEGTHDELMELENGEYKRMFNTQAEEYLKKGDSK